jgi:cytidine deaminase
MISEKYAPGREDRIKMDDKLKNKLIEEASKISGMFDLNGFDFNTAGAVGAALITDDGAIYTGINMDIACGIGFCAEHSAISSMLKDRKTAIKGLVAVRYDGAILPPCGRCRELMVEVDRANVDAEIIVGEGAVLPLGELLPHRWTDIK